MHPHHRPSSLQTTAKYERLTSSIHSSTSPDQISSTCSLISSSLHPSSPDHSSRLFFSLTFPSLIQRLFSFHLSTSTSTSISSSSSSSSSSFPPPNGAARKSGWIDVVLESNNPNLASAIFHLLSPDGVVLKSISAVDRLSLVKYVFPVERLPEWTQFLLAGERDHRFIQVLCPIFGGSRLKEEHCYDYGYSVKGFGGCKYQVHLNVFEYYMFWFAYYPVCKSNLENSEGVMTVRKSRKFRLEDWTTSIPRFAKISGAPGNARGNERKLECDLYIRLLYAYLRCYVPVYDVDLDVHQPCRSSLLHYDKEYDKSAMTRAEFLVNLFVNYWLVDNDFSPVSRRVTDSFGARKFLTVSKEAPPGAGLGGVVKLLVKYLNLSVWNGLEEKESADPMKLHRTCSVSWNLWLQRPLYRYLLRSFLFRPVGAPMRNVSEAVAVWACYMEPWSVGPEDFAELDVVVGGERLAREVVKQKKSGYSARWQGYVLSNYLYYSSLVMHFIGFSHKFLHVDAELIVQMVLQVLSMVTSSPELLDLIKKVDTLLQKKELGYEKSTCCGLYRYISSIREQLQDWEEGLSETDADGSFLHENWNKDVCLFGDGGLQLFQLFIMRAEAELRAIPGNSLANLQLMDSLRSQVRRLFGGEILKSRPTSSEVQECDKSKDGIFKPRTVGHNAFQSVKFKGDWMRRPVSNDEIAWLVKLLIRLSSWLNKAIGLHSMESEKKDESPWPYIELSGDVSEVRGPLNTMKVVLCAVGSWLLMLVAAIASLMREHGVRVNLRILASKRIVLVVICLVVYSVMKRVFCT